MTKTVFNIKYGLLDLKFYIYSIYSSLIYSIIKENIFSNKKNVKLKCQQLKIHILDNTYPNRTLNINFKQNLKFNIKNKFIFGLNTEYEEIQNNKLRCFIPTKKNISAPNFYLSNSSLYIQLPSITNDSLYYINRIISSFIQAVLSQKGFYTIHASSIVFKNLSFAFPGISGSGKSTLIHYLIQTLKCKYVTNDRILISSKGLIHSLPLPFRIKKNNLSEDISLVKIINDYALDIEITLNLNCFIFPMFKIDNSMDFNLIKIGKTQFQKLFFQNIQLHPNNPFIDYKRLKTNLKTFIKYIYKNYPAYILYFNQNSLKNKKLAIKLLQLQIKN